MTPNRQPQTVVVSDAWMELAADARAYWDDLAAQWRESDQRYPQPLQPGEPLVWPTAVHGPEDGA